MSQKHTPGPWFYSQDEGNDPKGGHNVNTADYIICDLPDAGYRAAPEAEANARLIAAAPDLLKALCQLFKLLPDYPLHDPNRHIIDDARKAYHKAQGNA